jgi:hypothetical protein
LSIATGAGVFGDNLDGSGVFLLRNTGSHKRRISPGTKIEISEVDKRRIVTAKCIFK